MPAAWPASTPAGASSTTAQRSGSTPTRGRGVQEQVGRGLADADVLGAEQPVAEAVDAGPPGSRVTRMRWCSPLDATQVDDARAGRASSSTVATPGTASTCVGQHRVDGRAVALLEVGRDGVAQLGLDQRRAPASRVLPR